MKRIIITIDAKLIIWAAAVSVLSGTAVIAWYYLPLQVLVCGG